MRKYFNVLFILVVSFGQVTFSKVALENDAESCRDLLKGERYDYNSTGVIIAQHMCVVSSKTGILRKVTKAITRGVIPLPIIDWAPVKLIELTPKGKVKLNGSQIFLAPKAPFSPGIEMGGGIVPVDPTTNTPFIPIDPVTGKPNLPRGPITNSPYIPNDPKTGKPILPVSPTTGHTIIPNDPTTGTPILPTVPGTSDHFIPTNPNTGNPILPTNPVTGEPVIPTNPNTGNPILPINPDTGKPFIPINPNTGNPILPISPDTGKPFIPIDPNTNTPILPVNPDTGRPIIPINPVTGFPILPIGTDTGKPFIPNDPSTGKPIKPVDTITGKPVAPVLPDPNIANFPINPSTGEPIIPIDPKTGQPKLPINSNTGKPYIPIDTTTGNPILPINPDTGKPFIPLDPGTNTPLLPINPVTELPYIPINPETRNPILPINPNTGKPIIPVDDSGRPIFPIEGNGHPYIPIDPTGNPILPVGQGGKPYIPINHQTGYAILPISSDTGDFFIPVSAKGVALLPLDLVNKKPFIPFHPVTGKEILPISKKGNPFIPIDLASGKAILPIDQLSHKPFIPFNSKTNQPILPKKGRKFFIPIDLKTGKAILPIDPTTGKPFIPIDPISRKPILPIDPKTGKAYTPIDPDTSKPYPTKFLIGNNGNSKFRFKPGFSMARVLNSGLAGYGSIVLGYNHGCNDNPNRPCITVKSDDYKSEQALRKKAAVYKMPRNLGDLFQKSHLPKGLQLNIPSDTSLDLGVGQLIGIGALGVGVKGGSKSRVAIERAQNGKLLFSFINEHDEDINGVVGLLFLRANKGIKTKDIKAFDFEVDLNSLTAQDKILLSSIDPRKLLRGDNKTLKLFKEIMKRNGIKPKIYEKTIESSTFIAGPIIGKDSEFLHKVETIISKNQAGKVESEFVGITIAEGYGKDSQKGSARKTSYLELHSTGEGSGVCPSIQIESTLPTVGKRVKSYFHVLEKYWGDSIDKAAIDTAKYGVIKQSLAYKFDCSSGDLYAMKKNLKDDSSWQKLKESTCNSIASEFSIRTQKSRDKIKKFCANAPDDPEKIAKGLAKKIKLKKRFSKIGMCQSKSFYDRQGRKSSKSCLENKTKEIFSIFSSMRKSAKSKKSNKQIFKDFHENLAGLDFLLFKKLITPHWCSGKAWIKVGGGDQ